MPDFEWMVKDNRKAKKALYIGIYRSGWLECWGITTTILGNEIHSLVRKTHNT
jgi:hypothetical protein